ncbi:hypothetical protein Tdes44962_MAKER05296 [Teratosphaeria destructans]|uniref:Uncharacterized protein n=1 Tax=Teratosphaeria destructans TaxID=418781 RepID=A0A9W7VYV7_9PEZI|nr:hypothetical protein Tdes44962_MAKER05296 [Teratosphaeria destructans]
MALVASEAPQTPAHPKRARPNPSRRKASKLKANQCGQGISTDSGDRVALPNINTKPGMNRLNTEPKPRPVTRKISEPTRSVQSRASQQPFRPSALAKSNEAVSVPINKPKKAYGGSLALAAPALTTGGLLGCAASAAILTGVHLWRNFSGPEQAILAARSARLCVDNFTDELIASQKAGTYNADEALDVLRRTTLAYATSIPGGASTVENMFREVDMVRKQRGHEVNGVLAETHAELSQASVRGANSSEMRDIVMNNMVKLAGFAGRSVRDIVTRNPQLKPYRDGAVKSLRGPPDKKIPTVRLNMAVRQKPPS